VTYNIGTGLRLVSHLRGDFELRERERSTNSHCKTRHSYGVSRPAALAVAGVLCLFDHSSRFRQELVRYTYGAGSTNDPVITVNLRLFAIVGLTVTLDATCQQLRQ